MRKNKMIVISVVGIIIVALMLLGLTYGFFLTRIQGNTSAKSIEVVTGNSVVKYTDLSETDEEYLIGVGESITKSFTVENIGNVSATYSIALVEVSNNFVRTEDVRYTLYRIGNNGTFPTNYEGCLEETTNENDCKVVVNDIEYPSVNAIVKANEINSTPGNIFRYNLVITYINQPDINQNEDQGKTFAGKIQILSTDDINEYVSELTYKEGTLAYAIYNNESVTKYETAPDFTSSSIVSGLYKAEDDYGTSWYFRGEQSNNYVSLAGFTWRIARINGDGSVRLIMDKTLSLDEACSDTTICPATRFSENEGDNAYIGYMYGTSGSDNYDDTHDNVNDSAIKEKLDAFYVKYLETNYRDYMADTIFCGDKTLASDGYNNIEKQLGYGTNDTYYAAYQRMAAKTPTLKCAEGANDDYSRYTVDAYHTTNGVQTNGDLKYPIALFSLDEMMMAGTGRTSYLNNDDFYDFESNYDGSDDTDLKWWLMSPGYFAGDTRNIYTVMIGASSIVPTGWGVYGVRPVINLKADVLVAGGDGTKDTTVGEGPYTVKLS